MLFAIVILIVLAVGGSVAWLEATSPAPNRSLAPSARPEPPACGGIAAGCPVCLAAAIACGVVLGSWLDGE